MHGRNHWRLSSLCFLLKILLEFCNDFLDFLLVRRTSSGFTKKAAIERQSFLNVAQLAIALREVEQENRIWILFVSSKEFLKGSCVLA